jgi:hypothetical protein
MNDEQYTVAYDQVVCWGKRLSRELWHIYVFYGRKQTAQSKGK